MPAPSRAVTGGFAVLAFLMGAWVAALAGVYDPGPLAEPLDRWGSEVVILGAAVLCLARALSVREERPAWLLLGTGMLLWGLGDLYFVLAFWSSDEIPIPSPADYGYLAFYPLAYCAVVMLLRARVAGIQRSLWVDGLVAALAVAALADALLFRQVLDDTGGEALAVATNLAYPVGDMLLIALIVGVLGASGWRLDATWAWIGAGLLVFAAADGGYLYRAATGAYRPGEALDAGWSLAFLMIAWGAWRPGRRREPAPAERWRTILIPIACGFVALALLVHDHFERHSISAVALAGACLGAVMVRLVLTYRDNLVNLARLQAESVTDALTGLGNRRRLLRDLDDAVAGATAERPVVLALYDLDGFKHYNDTYGHPAGDALLARLGARLAALVGDEAGAYRMGGDEFCVLAGDPETVALAAEALSEQGDGFAISCSYGVAFAPDDADSGSTMLRVADTRMFVQKRSGRRDAGRQSRDVLRRALEERSPSLATHLGDVADLVEATASRLGLDVDGIERARTAAELHDVGKVGIPDAILEKPGPLDDEAWSYVRRHTEIGERIVAAAPSLVAVAALVRSSHERWDGTGYPDGLAGEEIPLGARIVAACDAYDAMTSNRPYRPARSAEDAIAELRRCAGSQFDPVAVEAVIAALAARPAAGAEAPVD